MKALVLENLNVEIGSFGIENLDLSVEEGEIFVILGDNGAGKTKLLETISGFWELSSGRITLFGEDITYKPTRNREIGFIFQDMALFPHMTVKKNILYGTRYTKGTEIERKFSELIALFGLEKFLDRFPQTLSGGEKQKVALARTLITDPKLILLDEPTAAISISERERIDTEIKDTLKKFGKPALFVTHNENEAFLVGDRIAVMDNGRILQTGKADEIFYRPASEKIANFLGDTNIFKGTVSKKGDGTVTVDVEGVDITAIGDFEPGKRVKMFVRPENVLLMKEPYRTSARNLLHGSVKNVLPRGLLMKVEIDAGIQVISFITRNSVEEFNVRHGTEFYVEFKATAIHIIEER